MKKIFPSSLWYLINHHRIMNALVNGSLIEYKWFQPHFTANLFHLSLFPSLFFHRFECLPSTAQASDDKNKKVILHHHLVIQTIIGNEHLKQLIQNSPQTWHNIACPYVEHTITITKWFICKYEEWKLICIRRGGMSKLCERFEFLSEAESMNQTVKFKSQTCS
jgi:hypothetical protein